MPNTRSSSRRARRLPWDVLVLVFLLSDAPTLAVLGRVSLDFLITTSPLLYRDVEISSLKQLGELFCQRQREERENSSSTSRINPHLSLSPLQSLNLDFTLDFSDLNEHWLPSIDASRLLSAAPLPLQSLRIHLRYQHSSNHLYSLLVTSILPHLNPLRYDFAAHDDSPPLLTHSATSWIHSPFQTPLLEGWTRLEIVTIKGHIPYRLSETLYRFQSRKSHIAHLPESTLSSLRQIRFDGPSISIGGSVGENIRSFHSLGATFSFGAFRDGALVMEVRSEEERLEAEEVVGTLVWFGRKFSVEVAS